MLLLPLLLQLKAKGQLPPTPAPEEEKKDDKPSFKPFAGKGFSLRG
jgi:hypothetical protein